MPGDQMQRFNIAAQQPKRMSPVVNVAADAINPGVVAQQRQPNSFVKSNQVSSCPAKISVAGLQSMLLPMLQSPPMTGSMLAMQQGPPMMGSMLTMQPDPQGSAIQSDTRATGTNSDNVGEPTRSRAISSSGNGANPGSDFGALLEILAAQGDSGLRSKITSSFYGTLSRLLGSAGAPDYHSRITQLLRSSIEQAFSSLPGGVIGNMDSLLGGSTTGYPATQMHLPQWTIEILRRYGVPQTKDSFLKAAIDLSKSLSAPQATTSNIVHGSSGGTVTLEILQSIERIGAGLWFSPPSNTLDDWFRWKRECKDDCYTLFELFKVDYEYDGIMKKAIDEWLASCLEDCDDGPKSGNTKLAAKRQNSHNFADRRLRDRHHGDLKMGTGPFDANSVLLMVGLAVLVIALLIGLVFGAFFGGPAIGIGGGAAAAGAALAAAAAALLAFIFTRPGDMVEFKLSGALGGLTGAARDAAVGGARAAVQGIVEWIKSLFPSESSGGQEGGPTHGSGMGHLPPLPKSGNDAEPGSYEDPHGRRIGV